MAGFNWTCPFCQHAQVVTGPQHDIDSRILRVEKTKFRPHEFTAVGYVITGIACANPDCGEMELWLRFGSGRAYGNAAIELNEETEFFQLRPSSSAKPQPHCVPAFLTEDYYEACKIRDLSPKASATLSRRCLQGMIRDFCGITRPTLFKEIEALEELAEKGALPRHVDAETIEAMHYVRTVGNIGAHMEKDINIIVAVDPDEAQQLIGLIELLFKDWYVARHERQQRLEAIRLVAEQKKAEQAKSAQAGS